MRVKVAAVADQLFLRERVKRGAPLRPHFNPLYPGYFPAQDFAARDRVGEAVKTKLDG